MAGLGVPRQQTNWADRSRDFLKGAGSSYAQMMKEEKKTVTSKAPGKTAGGALMSSAGMGMAGYSMGSAAGASFGAAGGSAAGGAAGAAGAGAAKGSSAGWWGAGIGALIGLGAYLLS